MLSYDAMYAVIAIVVSMLVVSEWLRDLTVRVLARMIGAVKCVLPQAFKFAKFVVCAAVLYATLPALHSFMVVEIAKQGGIDAIIKALGNHPDHAGVQEYGCGALMILAANDANRVEIAKQGGIDAIIKALGNHPDHAEVQRRGCGALGAALGMLAENPEIKQEIIKKGGEKYLK